jgi:hypothetical protein
LGGISARVVSPKGRSVKKGDITALRVPRRLDHVINNRSAARVIST